MGLWRCRAARRRTVRGAGGSIPAPASGEGRALFHPDAVFPAHSKYLIRAAFGRRAALMLSRPATASLVAMLYGKRGYLAKTTLFAGRYNAGLTKETRVSTLLRESVNTVIHRMIGEPLRSAQGHNRASRKPLREAAGRGAHGTRRELRETPREGIVRGSNPAPGHWPRSLHRGLPGDRWPRGFPGDRCVPSQRRRSVPERSLPHWPF